MGVLTGIKGTRQGWVRQIRANDTTPGLYVVQDGAGHGVHIRDVGIAFTPPPDANDRFGLFVEQGIDRYNAIGITRAFGEMIARLVLYGTSPQGGAIYAHNDELVLAALPGVELGGDINPMTYGGFKIAIPFSIADLAANLVDFDVPVAGGNGLIEVVMPFAGSILGISVLGNAACTVDSANFEPTINGVDATGLDALIDTTNTTEAYDTTPKDTAGCIFAAGANIGCHVTTLAGFLPAGTTDYIILVVVEF